MRALSLTQPWAWLVVHGGKDIENRTWNTKFRGAFLIHASKGMKPSDYDAAQRFAESVHGYQFAHDMPLPEQLERGGIIGAANLYTVIHPLRPTEMPMRLPWHMPEQFGFVLGDVSPVPFVACQGALGFWGNFALLGDGRVVQRAVQP
jgi:hypothetical protein